MNNNRLIIEHIENNGCATKIKLKGSIELQLRPFLYLRQHDVLEFIPSVHEYKEIYKVFEDRATKELKKVKIYPPYERKEVVYAPPHNFEVIFRERKDAKDWDKVRGLERFHYRGKGLDKIVGRRTVLLAEMEKFGVVGFGVLSASMAAVAPRFKLLNTNFSHQMKNGLINRIVRIPRIVIHPEFRGLNLGVLMAKHLVNYAQEYWDINHYKPIMVEVIAAMTDYHKFFEKAGFSRVGYTTGYRGKAIIPKYGNGSFAPRDSSKYDFMENQSQKPYLVYPLTLEIKQKLKSYSPPPSLTFFSKMPKLEKPLIFESVSLEYIIKNGSTKRTNIVKEVFGVDSSQAFSPVVEDFSVVIEPGDVVLIIGASGSGKSTILKLLTLRHSILKKIINWSGTFPRIRRDKIEILNANFSNSRRPLIEQVKKNKDVKEAIELLNSVGLTEAHLYIKRPNQISDGQRYRFAIAKLCDSEKPIWIADEFVSALNPEMAAIVAKGLRKVAYKCGATLILAAPHISYFVESLLPNKLVKLRWGIKPIIYSLKIISFSQKENELSLSVLNNGSLPLTSLQIGLNTINGLFKPQSSFDCVSPKQIINAALKIGDNEEFYALMIKTSEGVGEIIYRQ